MLFQVCFYRSYHLDQSGGGDFSQLPAFVRIPFRDSFLQLAGRFRQCESTDGCRDSLQRVREAFHRFTVIGGKRVLYGLH